MALIERLMYTPLMWRINRDKLAARVCSTKG